MNTIVKPQGCTNFRLRRLTRIVSRHYDTYMAACGLKTSQYSLLSHVQQLGPLRPVDLARAMGVDASTLTRNLRPLTAAGWVVQGAGVDARSNSLSITDAGRDKRIEAQRLWRAAQLSLNDMLGSDHVAALHALLDDTLDRLQQAGLNDGAGERDE